jgi:hypothetical protein
MGSLETGGFETPADAGAEGPLLPAAVRLRRSAAPAASVSSTVSNTEPVRAGI